MRPTLSPVFAVPFGQAVLEDPAFNSRLRDLILQREPSSANPTPSLQLHPGVFESRFDFFSWPDRDVQRLREFCWTALAQVVGDANGYAPDELQKLQIFSHTWFHVTRKPGFTVMHTHPMASWSGVYCVSPGTEPADRPESGVLRFHNPHHYSGYFLDAGNARLRPPYHHGSWSVRLAMGQLVLFPSWLQHEVLPYYGEDERITVAFNCWFK